MSASATYAAQESDGISPKAEAASTLTANPTSPAPQAPAATISEEATEAMETPSTARQTPSRGTERAQEETATPSEEGTAAKLPSRPTATPSAQAPAAARKPEALRAHQTPHVCPAATETPVYETLACTCRLVETAEVAAVRETAYERAVAAPFTKTQAPSKAATALTERGAAKATNGCNAFALTTEAPTAESHADLVGSAKEHAGPFNEVSEPQAQARTTARAETRAKTATTLQTETKTSSNGAETTAPTA